MKTGSFDLEAVKEQLLLKYPDFYVITANVKFQKSNIRIAATDGYTIYYNENAMKKYTQEQQVFILAHEICHIALDHILRVENRDKDLWNIATDAVINAYLKRDKLKLIPKIINYPDAVKYNAEELYDELLKEKQNKEKNGGQGQQNQQGQGQQSQGQSSGGPQGQNNQNQQGQNGQSSSGSNQSGNQDDSDTQGEPEESKSIKDLLDKFGHDDHSKWEDAVKQHHEQEKQKQQGNGSNQQGQQDQKGQSKDKGQGNSNGEQGPDDDAKKAIDDAKKKFEGKDMKDIFDQNAKHSEELQKDIQKEMDRGELKEGTPGPVSSNSQSGQAGTGSAYADITMSNVGEAPSLFRLDRYLRPPRRFREGYADNKFVVKDGGMLKRIHEQKPIRQMDILIDTSGSIDDDILKSFLQQCKSILINTRGQIILRIGSFSDRFDEKRGFVRVRTPEEIDNLHFIGRGGTNFHAAIEAFQRYSRGVENLVILTDGEDEWRTLPECRAIWVIYGGKRISPPGGKTINISLDSIRKGRYR